MTDGVWFYGDTGPRARTSVVVCGACGERFLAAGADVGAAVRCVICGRSCQVTRRVRQRRRAEVAVHGAEDALDAPELRELPGQRFLFFVVAAALAAGLAYLVADGAPSIERFGADNADAPPVTDR